MVEGEKERQQKISEQAKKKYQKLIKKGFKLYVGKLLPKKREILEGLIKKFLKIYEQKTILGIDISGINKKLEAIKNSFENYKVLQRVELEGGTNHPRILLLDSLFSELCKVLASTHRVLRV